MSYAKYQSQSSTYRGGLRGEQRVIQALGLTPATWLENMRDDVDAWLGPTPVSIKCDFWAKRTGRTVIELSVLSANGVERETWGTRSKAELFLYLIGDDLYWMDRPMKEDFIARQDEYPIRGLSEATKKKQAAMGHSHRDARLLLVPLSELGTWDDWEISTL